MVTFRGGPHVEREHVDRNSNLPLVGDSVMLAGRQFEKSRQLWPGMQDGEARVTPYCRQVALCRMYWGGSSCSYHLPR